MHRSSGSRAQTVGEGSLRSGLHSMRTLCGGTGNLFCRGSGARGFTVAKAVRSIDLFSFASSRSKLISVKISFGSSYTGADDELLVRDHVNNDNVL